MSDLYTTLKSGLNTVDVDGHTLFVAEGDRLLDDEQLKAYAEDREEEKAQREAGDEPSRELLGIKKGNKTIRWRPGLDLTYRVARSSFPGEAQYKAVVDAIHQATTEWEQTCGVNFAHKVALDSRPGVGREGLIFVVRYYDVGGKVIASAFFPNDPVERRQVLIDPSFYTTSFDRVGVLRHELGHVLGFRHEHIRNEAPPVCPNEPLWDVSVLSKYDPQSVMHYFCGGVGSNALQISALDRSGAQKIYGNPLSDSSRNLMPQSLDEFEIVDG